MVMANWSDTDTASIHLTSSAKQRTLFIVFPVVELIRRHIFFVYDVHGNRKIKG